MLLFRYRFVKRSGESTFRKNSTYINRRRIGYAPPSVYSEVSATYICFFLPTVIDEGLGKRMECFYTVYVPFLPQHYRDRVKTDSIAEEELKQAFVEWEEPARFQDGNPNAVQNYIYSKLKYDSDQLGGLSLARGIYRIDIDSYGEIRKVGTVKSCGLPEWDRQVEEIIKGMPRWTPAVSYSGKGSYQNSIWTVPVVFRGDCQ
ncbi:tonB family domain protein [Bacteroides sp. CAG:714]|nr:tonB family domain protein [Bacteroides sp. CAG:714]